MVKANHKKSRANHSKTIIFSWEIQEEHVGQTIMVTFICQSTIQKKIWVQKRYKDSSYRQQDTSEKIKMERKEKQKTVLQMPEYIISNRKDGTKSKAASHDVILKVHFAD